MTWFAPLVLAILSVSVSGQAATHQSLFAAEPHFDVRAFFSGSTQGIGRIKVMMRRAKPFQVKGTGHIDSDGALLLDQRRSWRIEPLGRDRYGGTLTKTTEPIIGDVIGNRLHLRLKFKGGIKAEQWIYLQPGNRMAINHMIFRKFGVVVAVLDETISKVD